jgi:hypothetical protein
MPEYIAPIIDYHNPAQIPVTSHRPPTHQILGIIGCSAGGGYQHFALKDIDIADFVVLYRGLGNGLHNTV